MRSRHVDHFNHDTEVHGYDAHVADESNPVRNGYDATLDWVIEHAAVGRDDVVVDLGTGTGNLAARLGGRASRRLVCVDVSTAHARRRQDQAAGGDRVRRGRPPRVRRPRARPTRCDVVMSTYAIHHLTAEEKIALLEGLFRLLHPDGRLAIGDLMAVDRRAVPELRQRLSHPDVDELFDDEFPGSSTTVDASWSALGFDACRASRPACSRGDWAVPSRSSCWKRAPPRRLLGRYALGTEAMLSGPVARGEQGQVWRLTTSRACGR